MKAPFSYKDFDLLIEPGEQGRYRARVLQSPAGESGPVRFELPFSPRELEDFVLEVGQARRGTRGPGRPESAPLKEFGGKLYNAVFQDDLRDMLMQSLVLTSTTGVGLRLRLRLADAPDLAELPWEFLYDQRRGGFLAQSRRTPIVRYLDFPNPPGPLAVDGPLRLLVMISSPTGYPALDVEQEWRLLTEALAKRKQAGQVIIKRLDAANMSMLRRRVREEEFHVFHFVGHGLFQADWGDGVLVMEDRDSRPQEVTGEELGRVLSEYGRTRLAVLNACEGARSSAHDPFAGVAQSLIQQGLPAVVAMQFAITDAAALIFARELYGAIAGGYPLEAALAEARGAISDEGNPTEWGTPVLYSRAPDGCLFDLAGQAPDLVGEASQSPQAARSSGARTARLLADAERIARSISDKRQKAMALADVASVPTATDADAAARLRADAERIAQSIFAIPPMFAGLAGWVTEVIEKVKVTEWSDRLTDKVTKRADTLAYLARTLAATDPDRAERIARSLTDDYGSVRADVAATLAATDPGRAERIARSIVEGRSQARALAAVAAELAATDPDRATGLFADAERIAHSLTGGFLPSSPPAHADRAGALADIARLMAASELRRAGWLFAEAERIAKSIANEAKFTTYGFSSYDLLYGDERARALADVASALAATDPDRAERIAQSITDKPEQRARALNRVAKALAASDPDRAKRIAYFIDEEHPDADVLADVAAAVAAADPDRAERIARSITGEFSRARALVKIAKKLELPVSPPGTQ